METNVSGSAICISTFYSLSQQKMALENEETALLCD